MADEKQRTLVKTAVFSGKGLHTGLEAAVRIEPAGPDAGLTLRAGDLRERLRPALSDGTRNANTFRLAPETEIATIEHLLSALWGTGIDNAEIDVVQGREPPALDGSAAEYVRGLKEAGIVEQEAPRKVFVPKNPVSAGRGEGGATAYPAADRKFRITYLLDYPESPLARGSATFEITPESYAGEIAPARTFVMREHAEAMLQAGLGRGANPQNTLVIDGDKVVDNRFRLPDECLRHKILDLVGDLAVLNRRLGVHVVASKSGHAVNLELAAALERAIRETENPAGIMDFRDITDILPHRYPFLLIDRVIELEEKRRIVAVKNLTFNEAFFQGHFPGRPILPGVLQIEALAQAGAIMMLGEFKGKGKLAVLMSADDVKWRRRVIPGDRLFLHAEFVKMKSRIGVVRAWAEVEGEISTEATIKFAIIDANPDF
ncbi:MAG: 3-hydroxyacyl-ACP dehydratase FabZ [Planctomycetota bacterium]|jgi:UDP-3-O-[3-hydroxymyristoyl] N-acetylglucosamine deacetylase/3-hydroxyacyl-[acyl-carrier-protein] dehydratase|nr:3-hydroxyacyl-ACP dehydratase FabZ [Planctomycetota bacterium]